MSSEADIPEESIAEAQEDIVSAFELLGDWTERYQYIIDLGKALPAFPDDYRTEPNRLHGCQSQVWMVGHKRDGRLFFEAISDSAIVSGLIALLLKVYSGREPQEIIANPPDFIGRIQLQEHLSPTRSNGLGAMITRIRQLAAEHA